MLVTRRRVGEALLIGDEIEVHIVEIGPNHVRLGISAPRNIPVVRKELQSTAEENRAAAEGVSVEALAMISAQFGPRKAEGEARAKRVKPLRWLKDDAAVENLKAVGSSTDKELG